MNTKFTLSIGGTSSYGYNDQYKTAKDAETFRKEAQSVLLFNFYFILSVVWPILFSNKYPINHPNKTPKHNKLNRSIKIHAPKSFVP